MNSNPEENSSGETPQKPRSGLRQVVLIVTSAAVLYVLSIGPVAYLMKQMRYSPAKEDFAHLFFLPPCECHRLSFESQIREHNRKHAPEVIGTERELKITPGFTYDRSIWLSGLDWYLGVFVKSPSNELLRHCPHATTPGRYFE